MRILQISSARAMGGGERHLADLANGLCMAGHDLYVALASGSPVREHLVAIEPDRVFELGLRNALDMKSALQLSRIIRDHEIEIVHAHLARDYPMAAIAVRLARRAQLMITRHVMFPLSRAHRFTLARVARVIAVSSAVERSLKGQRIFSEERIRLVHNGVDFARLDSRAQPFDRAGLCTELGLNPSRRFIATVGEITPLKGQADFVRAAAAVAESCDEVDFLIIGKDKSRSGEHEVALKRLIEASGLQSRVFRFGWLDNLPAVYRLMDVFVSASHSESFGLAIAEAMAMGVAVVATETDGAKELIVDRESGRLVRRDDPEALAATVAELLADEELRRCLGLRAREVARKELGVDRMIRETEAVYHEALYGDSTRLT